MLELLESRFLLSMSPLVPEDRTGVLFSGGTGDDSLYLRINNANHLEYSLDGDSYLSGFGGVPLEITPGFEITVDLGSGNDSLAVDSTLIVALEHYDGRLFYSGGEGSNTLFGPGLDSTWTVSGADAGVLGSRIHFTRVGNLIGAADNEDTFIVTAQGRLSGMLDGGPGGFDSLVLEGGRFERVEYVATGPHSGWIDRDGDRLYYDGLEPITDNSLVADRVIDLSSVSDDATFTQSGTSYTVGSAPGAADTFESVTFTKPTNSLTINLGDDLGVELLSGLPLVSGDKLTVEDVDLSGVALTIDGQEGLDRVVLAGSIQVADLVVRAETIQLTGGVSAASVTLDAAAESTGRLGIGDDGPEFDGLYVAVPRAAIEVTGSLTATGAVTMDASATATVAPTPLELGPVGGALVVVMPSATIDVDGATINAPSLSAHSMVDVQIDAQDAADADDDEATVDAAVAVTVVQSTSQTSVTGTSVLAVSGDVSLTAATQLNVASNADGTGGTAGGTVAVSQVAATTLALVADSASIVPRNGDAPDSITVVSNLTSDIATTATSTAGGGDQSAGGTNESERRLADPNQDGDTSDRAETSDGAVTFAGAVVVSDYHPTTEAYLNTSGNLTTGGVLSIAATATESVRATADGSTTGGSGTGVGVAVAIGVADVETRAWLGGSGAVAASDVQVTATLDAASTYQVDAIGGAGDGNKTGVAGALSVNVVKTQVEALVDGDAAQNLNDTDLTLVATNETKTVTSAVPKSSGAASDLGIGASVALLVADNTTRASVQQGAILTGVRNLTLTATGSHDDQTTAEAGGKSTGGTGIGGAVAIAVVENSTEADVEPGDTLQVTGDLLAKAVHHADSVLLADGTALAANAAVGAAIALAFVENRATSRTRRNTVADGEVSFAALADGASVAEVTASAAGADKEDEADGGNSTADDQTAKQTSLANAKSGKDNSVDQTANTDGEGDSSGSVGVAAALAINVSRSDAVANVPSGITSTWRTM